ncbi:hypothetical protein KIW84_020872 [Lathyrus oleraceus]|uniref:DNA-directed RNA polymerase n=1 Tax=Pisum sativum TaxID=3888 RepID=A0A9D4YAT9_PEA|nr:hypothetical protein KIW84_020872 [Pisum sativum]
MFREATTVVTVCGTVAVLFRKIARKRIRIEVHWLPFVMESKGEMSENTAVTGYPTSSNWLLTEKQQHLFFEIIDPEASDTAVPALTVAQNDVVNNGRPVRQRALPHRLRDYERFQDNKVNNDGDFVHFALMAESEPAKLTYSGRFSANVCLQYEGDAAIVQDSFSFGQFPIMLKFKRCNLRGASPRKLVSLKEEASEMGGYFIVNGLERYIRPIIMPKRNYPMSTVRSSFSEKREGYADKAVVIRCVRADQTSLTVKLYYLRNGSARLGFWIQGREYMLPVGIFLKALIDTTDREIYVNLTSCYNEKYEKEKEKYAITDMRKLANRMQFGIPEESSLGDGLGEGYGMLGQAGSGKLRVSVGQSKLAAKVAKKFKEKDYGSSGATSGLTSSLAFTPVNGIELTNPQAHAHQLGSGTQSTYFSETGTI